MHRQGQHRGVFKLRAKFSVATFDARGAAKSTASSRRLFASSEWSIHFQERDVSMDAA